MKKIHSFWPYFWSKVKKHKNGCWIWTAAKVPFGYGVINFKGNQKRAHRLSYERIKGPIPKGKFICHKCDNPSCVRPGHLFAGSQKENIRDMINKDRYISNFGYGHKNNRTKLTENKVAIIRRLYGKGIKMRELARQNEVSLSCIQHIIHGKTWK